MRSFFTNAAAAAAILLPVVVAAPEPNTLKLDFKRHPVPASRNVLNRRQTSQTVNTAITNYQNSLYLINVTVGTPPQSISLQLDTGSSDLWFPSSNASYCKTNGPCLGTYDSSASSTYQDAGMQEFKIAYEDGTMVTGAYIRDTISFGGITLTNLTMADAFNTGQSTTGIMGIAFRADEAEEPAASYPNVIDVLVSEGKINTRSYSLWLDDLQSNTGSILFGGVDKSKYTGDLLSVPIQPDSQSGSYTSFTVALTGLTATSGNQVSNLSPSSPVAAILDSGTTLLYLPDDMTNNIWNGIGVVTSNTYGPVVPCSLANDQLDFTFQFGGSSGPKINCSISEFVLPLVPAGYQAPSFKSGPYKGQTVCQIGILPADGGDVLFGDTFLRSAYVVYDLDNLEVGLAQSNFGANTGEQSVQAFSSGSIMPDVVSTITGVSVAGSSETALPSQYSAVTATTGDVDSAATTRTPTFSLVSGTASSTSSKGAAAPVNVPSIERSTIAVFGVTVAAFLFGTLLL